MTTITANGIAVDCPDPVAMAAFYSELLGVKSHGNYVLVRQGKTALWFQPVEDYQPPTWPTQEHGQQLHLDFAAADIDGAIALAIALGATLTERQDGYHYPILLDPAGHPFCLIPADALDSGIELCVLNFDCANVSALAVFYQQLLGGTVEEFPGWSNLARKGELTLSFQHAAGYRAPTWPTQERGQQIHIDFHTKDRTGHVQRAIELGATFQVKEKGFTALLDPAGHPFCICDDND